MNDRKGDSLPTQSASNMPPSQEAIGDHQDDNSSSPTAFWAYDSNRNELDPLLRPAQQLAASKTSIPETWLAADETQPMILRNLISDTQIDKILSCVSAPDVWPRGISTNSKTLQQREQSSATVCDQLASVAHHIAWTEHHVVLYMHTHNWFIKTLPESWCHIRGGMEYQPWMQDGIPVLDLACVAGIDDDQEAASIRQQEAMKHVRSIELHHYAKGGGLVNPGHRDCGSDRTLSILLSHPDDVRGGDFVTYSSQGIPVAHKLQRGDGILFASEKLHNISTVTAGVRQSLVVELWPSKRF